MREIFVVNVDAGDGFHSHEERWHVRLTEAEARSLAAELADQRATGAIGSFSIRPLSIVAGLSVLRSEIHTLIRTSPVNRNGTPRPR